jgi:serine/threonine protein kinase
MLCRLSNGRVACSLRPVVSRRPAALQAVHTIHEERIVHSDLKPANFLIVEGQLKLIDFGIAKAIKADTTSIARENQVGCCLKLSDLHTCWLLVKQQSK